MVVRWGLDRGLDRGSVVIRDGRTCGDREVGASGRETTRDNNTALPGGPKGRMHLRGQGGGLECLDVSGWTPQRSTSRQANEAHLRGQAARDEFCHRQERRADAEHHAEVNVQHGARAGVEQEVVEVAVADAEDIPKGRGGGQRLRAPGLGRS